MCCQHCPSFQEPILPAAAPAHIFLLLISALEKVIINQTRAHLAKFNVYEKFMSTFRLYDSPKASLNKFHNDLLLMANPHYLFEVCWAFQEHFPLLILELLYVAQA